MKHKLTAIASIFTSFAVLSALEGGTIGPAVAAVLIFPLEGVMLWALDKTDWLDSEAAAADWRAMKAEFKQIWIRE